jgi:hypothetical protein
MSQSCCAPCSTVWKINNPSFGTSLRVTCCSHPVKNIFQSRQVFRFKYSFPKHKPWILDYLQGLALFKWNNSLGLKVWCSILSSVSGTSDIHDSSGSEQGPEEGSCEDSNKTSVFCKRWRLDAVVEWLAFLRFVFTWSRVLISVNRSVILPEVSHSCCHGNSWENISKQATTAFFRIFSKSSFT